MDELISKEEVMKLKVFVPEYGDMCYLADVDRLPTISTTAQETEIKSKNNEPYFNTALSEVDFIELRHRYGESVEKTVRRMCGKQTAIKHFGAMECPNCGALFYEVPMIETVLEDIKAELEKEQDEVPYPLDIEHAIAVIEKHISGKE